MKGVNAYVSTVFKHFLSSEIFSFFFFILLGKSFAFVLNDLRVDNMSCLG